MSRELAELTTWLLKNGGHVDERLAMREENGRRVVSARTAIPDDTLLLAVPRALMITPEVAAESAIGVAIRDLTLADPHSRLAAWLLTERRKQRSQYGVYLRALPSLSAARDMPFHYGARERMVLSGTIALRRIERLSEAALADFAQLTAKIPAARDWTIDELAWARHCIQSRGFGVTINGEALPTTVFVPVADMLDHSATPEARWRYDADRGAFVIEAIRAIAADEEIRDSYGNKCNSRWLANYGFALDDNIHDTCELRVEVEADKRAHLLASALWQVPMTDSGVIRNRVPARYLHAVTRRMFSRLRLAFADAFDIEKTFAHDAIAGKEIRPLGRDTERAVWLAIDRAARAGLVRLGEVAAPLADGDSSAYRACVLARRGEERVLRAYVESAAFLLSTLTASSMRQFPPAASTPLPIARQYLLAVERAGRSRR